MERRGGSREGTYDALSPRQLGESNEAFATGFTAMLGEELGLEAEFGGDPAEVDCVLERRVVALVLVGVGFREAG